MFDTLTLVTHKNYMDRALKATPQNALYELIWNSCDADADNINISFTRNEMDNVISCRVEDNGTGINRADLEKNFGFLGLSDKQYRDKTQKGRIYHGKLGQGRYNAVSVATNVKWDTIYEKDGKFFSYSIAINNLDKQHIRISEEIEAPTATHSGTVVYVDFIEKKGKAFNELGDTIEQFVTHFAPYLKSYPTVQVSFDNTVVDVNEFIEDINTGNLDFKSSKDELLIADLIIIKWKNNKSKGQLHFCDATGTLIDNCMSYVYKGIDIYLCTHYFSEIDVATQLKSYRLDPILTDLVDKAIVAIKNYVESIQDNEIMKEITSLKKNKIYPYLNTPQTSMERVEQSQFDILAVEVNKILPQLRNSSNRVKKLTYTLLKETVKSTPDSFTEILNSIIALDDDQKESLAKILKTTSMPAIIKTSQLLINRSKFLDALYLMVYDDNVERSIKERTQFQKILLDNLWIFGEDYTYGADDISVRNLLKKYITTLERDELAPIIPEDGAYNLDRIPDICLFNKYPLGDNQYKNLVIEIKKPKKTLGKKEYDQIIDYHDIITKSAAFPGITTKWHFILIGKDFNDYVKDRIAEHAQHFGVGNIIDNENSRVSILTWGELIQRNKAKIEYLVQSLELRVGDESDILQFLHDNYGKYLNDKI